MIDQIFAYAAGTFVTLFPILNPLGAVPIFYSLTANDPWSYRLHQAKKITRNVVGMMVVFLLLGRGILQFFGISLGVLCIAAPANRRFLVAE